MLIRVKSNSKETKLKVKIIEQNKAKIEKLLLEVHGKAATRIVDYDFWEDLAKNAEQELDDLNVFKKYRKDCEFVYENGPGYTTYYGVQKDYPGMSDCVTLKRGVKDWFLIYAQRKSLCGDGKNQLLLSNSARDQKIKDIREMSLNN
jgi:hypothetical protein